MGTDGDGEGDEEPFGLSDGTRGVRCAVPSELLLWGGGGEDKGLLDGEGGGLDVEAQLPIKGQWEGA